MTKHGRRDPTPRCGEKVEEEAQPCVADVCSAYAQPLEFSVYRSRPQCVFVGGGADAPVVPAACGGTRLWVVGQLAGVAGDVLALLSPLARSS